MKSNMALFKSLVCVLLITISSCQSADQNGGYGDAHIKYQQQQMSPNNFGKSLQDLLKDHPKEMSDVDIKNLMDQTTLKDLGQLDPTLLMASVVNNEKQVLSKLSGTCQTAVLEMFAPLMNISSITPAALIALLGSPAGKGIVFFLSNLTLRPRIVSSVLVICYQ